MKQLGRKALPRSAIVQPLVMLAMVVGCAPSPEFNADVMEVDSTAHSLTFEQWKETVRFQGREDVYAVGHPASPFALVGDEEARAYFDIHVNNSSELIMHSGQEVPGDPVVGSYFPRGHVISYCVDRVQWEIVADACSDCPPTMDLYSVVADAFGSAITAWAVVAGVNIAYNVGRDDSCNPMPGDHITWYIKPYSPTGTVEYLTFVLRPHHNALGPDYREFFILSNVVVESVFTDNFYDPFFTMEGLMGNAIGKGLGFIDESNRGGEDTGYWDISCSRPDVGGVFMSLPDPWSVMTHPGAMELLVERPHCVGARDRDYVITYLDAMGASCQYRDEIFFYCNPEFQRTISETIPPDCSPVPYSASHVIPDCPPNSLPSQDFARKKNASIIEAILSD